MATNILNVRDLSKRYGPRVLFERVAFAVDEGEKVGVVGPNGCGKSTLFKILAGRIEPDEGIIALQRDATVGYLEQNPTFAKDESASDVVGRSLQPLKDAIAAFDQLSVTLGEHTGDALDAALQKQALLQAEIERRGGWAWEHRVADLLTRVGLPEDLHHAPAAQLSGGQQRRVALAQLLLEAPDLLILDEPTNHLDTETIERLEETLLEYTGTVLLVTHDRYVLDRVATRILEFDPEGLVSHPGSYEVYMARRIERMQLRERVESKRQRALAQELEWLRRSPKARTTKSVARIKRAEGLKEVGVTEDKRKMQLAFTTSKRLGGRILEIEGLRKCFDDHVVLDGVDLMVRQNDKLALVGPNGSGKSTLIKILVGDLEPDGGTFEWGKNTRVAYLDQDRSGLDPDVTVYESIEGAERLMVGDRQVHRRTYLREFLFEHGAQQKKVASLSGGERCRLLLAKMMLEGANFLVLDEPTNDLDIASLQVLEQALIEFNGCVLLVTHDRYFLNRVCNTLLVAEAGRFTRYESGYEGYRQRREAKRKEAARQDSEARRQQAEERRAAEEAQAPVKGLSRKERKELEGMEDAILEAESRKETLQAKLADPALYRERPDEVAGFTAALDTLTTEIEALYARWEELEARA